MPFVVGTDEAGYGPNLGPLVVSISVWEVPEGVGPEDLYARLSPAVADSLPGGRARLDGRVVIADSKRLYQPGKGLQHLERALWPAMAVLDRRPTRWREVWDALCPAGSTALDAAPWHAGYDRPVPLAADEGSLDALVETFRRATAAAGVRLAGLASRAVFPEEFNATVEHTGSKGAALTRWSVALVAEAVERLGPGPVSVVCDKHGGRNRYAAALMERFPGWLVEVRAESAEQSVYRFGPPERRVEARFCVRAERFLPVAMASVASKYLRELAMLALNDYWGRCVAGLRPTAGYPADARRFKAAIAAAQEKLGIEDQAIWRRR
jgi:ribonuclease HII